MNIALIDDMPQALTHTQELIRQFASSCNMDFSITCYSSSEELLADFTPHKYSILFIDSNFAHVFCLCTLKIQYLAVIQLSKFRCYAA